MFKVTPNKMKNKKILIILVIVAVIIAYRYYKKKQAAKAISGTDAGAESKTTLGNAISILTGAGKNTSTGTNPVIVSTTTGGSALTFDAKSIAQRLVKDIDGVSLVLNRDTEAYKIAAYASDSNLISVGNWYWTLYGKAKNETLRESIAKEKYATYGNTLTYAQKITSRLKNLGKR